MSESVDLGSAPEPAEVDFGQVPLTPSPVRKAPFCAW